MAFNNNNLTGHHHHSPNKHPIPSSSNPHLSPKKSKPNFLVKSMESSCSSEETRALVDTFSIKDKRRTQKRRRDSGYIVNNNNDDDEEEEGGGGDDDKAEVEKKILALQKIVPGGESLGVDMLFEETAGYILALQCQLKALKVLASFVEGSEKERMKLGG